MSQKDKLLARLLLVPSDFTYDEMRTLLGKLGYSEDNRGKTSGSRVNFIKEGRIISIHKPHPEKEVPKYAVRLVIDKLREYGDINEEQ